MMDLTTVLFGVKLRVRHSTSPFLNIAVRASGLDCGSSTCNHGFRKYRKIKMTVSFLLTSSPFLSSPLMRRMLSYYLLIASTLLLLLSAVSTVEITTKDGSPTVDATELQSSTPPEQQPLIVPEEFLTACTQGDTTSVQDLLKDHPEFLNGRSADGETCLHVAGIYGHAKIAELVLKAGGDPNIRSTFSGGLRMTPLSWNVYGGHVQAVQVLLEHGAHVNLDFDSSNGDGHKKVTVYDVLMDILDRSSGDDGDDPQQQAKENGMDRYWEIKKVLEKYGAKRHADLAAATEL